MEAAKSTPDEPGAENLIENDCIPKETPKDVQDGQSSGKSKKKNKKNKAATDTVANGAETAEGGDKKTDESMKMQQVQALSQAMQLLNIQKQSQAAGASAPRNLEEAKKREYKFWDTQPVPKINENVTSNQEIEPDLELDQVRAEPYSLSQEFYWDDINLRNKEHLEELYTLLNENYVEDDDNMFRFDYSSEFLHWALLPPGWRPEWHCGVRVRKNNKLIGFISAIPAHLKIHDREKQLVEINFLCVHKKLRKKRVAPVLIREITRRVNVTGLFQAVYTGGVVLPKPVATCRYWHRSLNPKKLIECKFSSLSKNMTMARTVKLYKLPDEPQTIGFKRMQKEHEEQAYNLLADYLGKLPMSPIFTLEEFVHWFRSREGIIDSFVVENEGKVTDFCSFYTLPSSVIQHPLHKTLKAAYSFHNVASGTKWADLMRDALISAKNLNFDVFNALDLMENKQFLEELKFGIGDGNLHYYLYNWKCPALKPEEVGLVLQ